MKLFSKLWNLQYLFSKKEDEDTIKKKRFMSRLIRTSAFARLSLQEKVLSLGKLINIFRADCGFTPRSLERTLIRLSAELKRHNDKTWDTLYGDPHRSSNSKE